jgi:hypothetical protein
MFDFVYVRGKRIIFRTDAVQIIKIINKRLCKWPVVVLRRCATIQNVPRSIPGGITGDISVASDKSMCPGSIQPLKNEYQGTSGV